MAGSVQSGANGSRSPTNGWLFFQHEAALAIFEPTQAREEGESEQVFAQRLVGMHGGLYVAHHDAADFDHAELDSRDTYHAVRGVCLVNGVARCRMIAEAGGLPLSQRDQRGAGIDHEADAPPVDDALDPE